MGDLKLLKLFVYRLLANPSYNSSPLVKGRKEGKIVCSCVITNLRTRFFINFSHYSQVEDTGLLVILRLPTSSFAMANTSQSENKKVKERKS